ncbi:hypothetical protein AV530_012296 [Patagioenas fasciata monilis]|uniref:5'-3' exonuclease PLD3 n=1 Tax=Patagioenas fasciata monilis TaxID=372326 RepID=A0A1V4KD30_PATFA|nr:hypothetical protein AV530_012296 [Patagioenas fasciata monilis]
MGRHGRSSLLIVTIVTIALRPGDANAAASCGDTCGAILTESIPEGMTFGAEFAPNPSTFTTWLNLMAAATRSLDIASFYWTLTNEDTGTREPSAAQGERILKELTALPQRGVAVRVAVSRPSRKFPLSDLEALEQSGAAVRVVDMPRLTGGVLHTKFWLVDGAHFYVGSANMDWRSLTQVRGRGGSRENGRQTAPKWCQMAPKWL